MSSSVDQRERWVGGLVVVCGALFVAFTAVALFGQGSFTRYNEYTLVLDDGTGLNPGIDVTIAGMKVGMVQSVHLTDDRQVQLRVAVQREYAKHVKVDSVGEAGMTILGGKVVRIGAGSPDALALADGGQMVAGNHFDVLRALEKMDLVHNLERLEAILIDMNELAKQMQLGDGKIPEAMDALMVLIGDLQDGKGSLGKLLKEDATIDEVRAAIEKVDRMAEKVESAAIAMERSTEGIEGAGDAVVNGANAIGGASDALSRTAASVDASAAKLADTLDRLDAGLVELEKTMRAIQHVPFVKGGVKKEEREEEGGE